MSNFPNPAQRAGWFAQNCETRFGGMPHNLHGLNRTNAGDSVWRCRCGHTGTEPTTDLAVSAHQRHVTQATPGRADTDIYATEEPTA